MIGRRGVRRALMLTALAIAGFYQMGRAGEAIQPPLPEWKGRLLGIAVTGPPGSLSQRLVRLDPLTLRVLKRSTIAVAAGAWSFSADRRQLALRNDRGELLLVDAAGLRVRSNFKLGVRGRLVATSWIGSRLAAVVRPCRGSCRDLLLVVDLRERRVRAPRLLDGSVQAVSGDGNSLVLLLGPTRGIGPSRLGIVDRSGRVTTVALDEIRSGSRARRQKEAVGYSLVVTQARPGVTLDGPGRRAFVVARDAPVAEIDLARRTVKYHPLSKPISLLGPFRDWLEPEARAAPVFDGPVRRVRWLGDGLLAVWGRDDASFVGPSGRLAKRQSAAGLKLIETRTWTVRTLEEQASSLVVESGTLLASAFLADSANGRPNGMGLVAFDFRGNRRFHLLSSKPLIEVQAVGTRAFVCCTRRAAFYTIVDLNSGRIVAGVPGDMPLALTGTTAEIQTP